MQVTGDRCRWQVSGISSQPICTSPCRFPAQGKKAIKKTQPGGWFLTCPWTISLHKRQPRASGGPKTLENISSSEHTRLKHWKTSIHIAHGLPAAARWPPGSSHSARGSHKVPLKLSWSPSGRFLGLSRGPPNTIPRPRASLLLALR